MSETERWQRHLWQLYSIRTAACARNGCCIARRDLMLLPDAFEAIDDLQLKAALPDTLHVSVRRTPEMLMLIFSRDSVRSATFGLYALNPCREFWDDLDTSRTMRSAGWAHRADKVGDQLAESEDPFSLNGASDPPALRLWGRPGREYIRLLNELSQCDFAPLFSDPVSSEMSTVLERLQQISSIANRACAGRRWRGQAVGTANQFSRVPGNSTRSRNRRQRNWSIIRSNEKIAAESKAERIRFHEIAVLIPDAAVDDYVAQIDSVFREQHRIPIDLVSRSIAGASRVAEAVDLLLQLPSGRFSRAEMIRLLTHPY